MAYKNSLIGIIAIVAVCTAAIITLSGQQTAIVADNKKQLPDAYMEEVSAIILDKVGKITMKIETPKMVHYTENDTTFFSDPQITLYHKSPNPWFIQSKTARAIHGMDDVIFNDDVVIHHPSDFNNPATIIKTSTLTVHPNQKTAETAQAITMIQPNSIMKGIGMHADMDSGNIRLLSQAQGEYVP